MMRMIATWEIEKCILEFARSFLFWLVVSKRLDSGSQAGMTQHIVWWGLFRCLVVTSKRLDPGSSKLAQDDTE